MMASPEHHTAADGRLSSSDSSSSGNGKKRKLDESISSDPRPLPRQPELPEFNLTSARPASRDSEASKDEDVMGEVGWQKVEGRPKKKAKKIPKPKSKNYPAIAFSKECRLQTHVKINDLQNLVLYILADGISPSFISVRHRSEIRKVVVLMVPGLELSMFDSSNENLETIGHRDGAHLDSRSPDDFYPRKLKSDRLPEALQPFADMFEHIWSVKTPGDDKYSKMHSPLHAMLTAPMQKTKEEKNWNKTKKGVTPAKEPQGWKNNRIAITELIHTAEELLENEYTLHPASYDNETDRLCLAESRRSLGVSQDHGWVDTSVKNFDEGTPPGNEIQAGSITAGREVLGMDCEMCMVSEKEFVLTRISIVAWDGTTVLDELVKPDRPITNYLTQYSGITEAMLAPVTTTLKDIQKKVVEILHPRTILVGHSLNSDLNALKITHPYIVDTAIIYPHPRGPPLKSALKYLAQKYLNREIQKGHGTTGPGAGHDSIEDARTCLDLVKQKCEKGKHWGTSDAQGENIFKRVARTGVRYKNQGGSAIPSPTNGKSSAMIDWGEPKKGPGAAATFPIGCHSDEEVMQGVLRAVKGDPVGEEIPCGGVDFVWARFRELEALKGWWNNNKQVAAQVAATPDAKVDPTVKLDEAAAHAPAEAPESKIAINGTDEPAQGTPLPLLNSKASTLPSAVEPTVTATPSSALPHPANLDTTKSVKTVTGELTQRIAQIYDQLPPCTALVVYSGSGDPREMSRLQAMQTQFKREYKIKKWDQLSVKWTDSEEQALKRAARAARNGIAFVGVK